MQISAMSYLVHRKYIEKLAQMTCLIELQECKSLESLCRTKEIQGSGAGLQYLKHIAYKSGMMGWRTLVSNHRGLGGVSVTVSFLFISGGSNEDHYV